MPFFADREESRDTTAGTAPVGVLFAFYPIDGLFYDAETASPPFAYHSAPTAFYETRPLLLQALATEAATRAQELTAAGGVADAVRVQDQVFSRLFPQFLGNDDPLGFLFVAYAREERKDGGLDFSFRFREEAFLKRLFAFVQLSCLYPTEWALPPAQRLDQLARELEGRTAEESWVLSWQPQGNEDDDLAGLYPKAPPAWLSNIAQPRAKRRRFLDDPVADALDFYGSAAGIVDLVVPLVDASEGKPHCAGFLRINCVRGVGDGGAFKALFATFDDHFRECSRALAQALRALERISSLPGVPMEHHKALRDLRLLVCDAIVTELVDAFQPASRAVAGPNSLGLARLQIARQVARLMSLPTETGPASNGDDPEAVLLAAEQELERFKQVLGDRSGWPEVLLVSVWTYSERPLIQAIEGTGGPSGAAEMIWADPGLSQFLAVLTDYALTLPSESNPLKDWHRLLTGHRHENLGGVPTVISPSNSVAELAMRTQSQSDGFFVDTELRPRRAYARGPAVITWRRGRFPRATAFRAIPGRLTSALERDLRSQAGDLRFAEPARASSSLGPPLAASSLIDCLQGLLSDRSERSELLRILTPVIETMRGNAAREFASYVVAPLDSDLETRHAVVASAGPSDSALLALRDLTVRTALHTANQVFLAEVKTARLILQKTQHALFVPTSATRQRLEDASEEWLTRDLPPSTLAALQQVRSEMRRLTAFCRVVQVLQGGVKADDWAGSTQLETELEDLSNDYYFKMKGVEIHIERQGVSRKVCGPARTWQLILYILLKNAAEAAERVGGKRVNIKITSPPDHQTRDTQVEIENLSPLLDPIDIQEAQAALSGEKKYFRSKKPDGMGLGLATVGELFAILRAQRQVHITASLRQLGDEGRVSVSFQIGGGT
jgi:hypothetical protein